MNPIGINFWNYVNRLSDDCHGLPEKIKNMGFTALEIPLTQTDFAEYIIREVLESGLQVSLCAALVKGYDISSFDKSIRDATKKYFAESLKSGEKVRAEILVGPLYGGGGKTHFLSEDDQKREWSLAVEGLREVAQMAADYGMKLGIEPLHRYRTSVVNTVDKALQLVEDIGMKNVGIHFDTFHACIEEVDMLEALKKGLEKKKIFHFHACENNRAAPSLGSLNWEKILKVLVDNQYEGHITMETFLYGGFDSGYTRSNKTPDEIALAGITCIKNELQKYNLNSGE